MPSFSPDEALQRDQAAMGSELGTHYYALHQEMVWLCSRWYLFRQLFATSQERVDLLNKTAGFFFVQLRDTLLDDVVLQLARLTDTISTAGHDHLTLRCLPTLIDDPEVKAAVEAKLGDAIDACRVPRDYRNQLIAHRDLRTALKLNDTALPGLTDGGIQVAIDACADVLNLLSLRYCDAVHGYSFGVAADGGAESLVYYLEKGLEADEAVVGEV